MSDMSFKQAKEIAERLEMSEMTLKSTLKNIEKATSKFDKFIEQEEELIKKDSKITNLKILIGMNIGFIIGLLVSKYFL
jgi:ElaB/YqjD/DUF883 family membrane-anchored ribosome-binding protein